MKTIAVAYNKTKPGAVEAATELAELLRGFRAEVFIAEGTDEALFTEKAELYISLGGDGSLLHLAGLLLGRSIDAPVLGINLGHTGYMSELDFTKCRREALEGLFNGGYTVERRMVIESELVRNGNTVWRGEALNDTVAFRGRSSHISEFVITADGREASRFPADGVIFSTPTGSTAYSLSAGGPVVDPTVRAIICTPVCAHNLSARPVVFSDSTILTLTMAKRCDSEIYIQNDGVNVAGFSEGDILTVRRSPKTVGLMRLTGNSFFATLNAKLK